MARKSPPITNTGCNNWPMFRFFNFSESHSKTRFVSAEGNGNLRSSSDVIGTVDEKYPRIGVSSRRRYFGCISISNVKNDRVADPRNEITKMVIDQRFTNQNFQGKDQLLDAVEILYSNKELFLKLLKDPNSMLVKQIHELPNSEVKKPYQALFHSSLNHNVQHIKPSNLLRFGRIKRKSRYVVKLRGKKQKQRHYRFTCGCHGIEDGTKANESKIAGISSSTSNSSRRRNTNNSPNHSEQDILNNVHVESEAISENFQLFGSDIRIRKSASSQNIHANYDTCRDGGFKDTPTHNFDINNDALGTFLDSNSKSHIFTFSPEVASSSQRIADNINIRNRIEHPSTEPISEHFTKEDVTNSKMTLHKPDESPLQVFEVTHFEDLIRPSLGLTNNSTSSKDTLDYVMKILHALSFKWDELFMIDESSTFDELNELLLTSQLSSNKVLVHWVIETLMEVYKNNGFPPKQLDIEAYVVNLVMVKEIIALINLHCLPHPTPIRVEELVEKDLAKNGSWLNIKVGIQDILIELEEHVLQKLVLEIVIEMDIRSNEFFDCC